MDSDLLNRAQDVFLDLIAQWDCRILFNPSATTVTPSSDSTSSSQKSTECFEKGCIDLLDYVSASSPRQQFPFVNIVTAPDKTFPKFCNFQFPPHYKGIESRDSLVGDIIKAAQNCGVKLTVGRAREYRKNKILDGYSLSLCCCYYFLYRYKSKILSSGGSLYQDEIKHTWIRTNRKFENRGKLGKTLPRKTTTVLPRSKDKLCPFHIIIYLSYSDNRWYLSKNGSGRFHLNHPKIDPSIIKTSMRHLDDDNLKLTKDCNAINVKPSSTARLIHQRSGNLISSQQVKHQRNKDKDIKELKSKLGRCQSSAEKLIQLLSNSDHLSFFALIHDPNTSLFKDYST